MNILKIVAASMLLMGCAGISRDCSSCTAENFGGDWIIVQYRMDGEPLNCWKTQNTGVSNEDKSDGVYWQDPGGHLVHISGWYNRVQVQGGRWGEAAKSLGIDESRCTGGVYQPSHDGGAK